MTENLSGKRIAIIATDGFEKSELFDPKQALEESGATVVLVSSKKEDIKGWTDGDWDSSISIDKTFDEVQAANFDGLFIPGGTLNCDKLRTDETAVAFVKDFFTQHKPVAAICHGPQLLIEADVVSGRKITSYAAIRTDLENAGAKWKDEECVVDQGLVTSREPKDLPTFIAKMIEEYAEGEHGGQHA
jgi:protease I